MQKANRSRRPKVIAFPAPERAEMPTVDEPILLRVDEAARLLRYGRSTVYDMVASGELAAIHRGRTTRIPREALDEWIARALAAD